MALKKIVLFAGITACGPALSQDLEKLDLKNPLKISGSLRATATGYTADGIANRRDPFYWLLSGTLNLQFLEFNIPFSVTLSQQQRTFAQPQPFNQFGLSPSYKGVTIHGGYRSMNFSDYTLAGQVFLGGGIEVKPKQIPIQLSALYGRLQKAVTDSITDGLVRAIPAYERWGHGAKITLGKEKTKADLIYFYAHDKPHSIPHADSLAIAPEENLVLGINISQKIEQRINVTLEYAYSMLTRDTRLEKTPGIKNRAFPARLGVFAANASSQFNQSIKSTLAYTGETYQADISYRRVDPEYRTLGATFVTNDFEDIALGISKTFFQGKLNVAGNVGLQRNNLDNRQLSELKRGLYGLNLSGNITEKLVVNASYNNFTTSTQMVQLDALDSLRYYQVTNNATLGISHTRQKEAVSHTGSLYINYQGADDSDNNTSAFYNVSGMYGINATHIAMGVHGSVNYNLNQIDGTNSYSAGPGITLSKGLFDKAMQCTLGGTYLWNRQEGAGYDIWSVQSNAAYRLKKKHQFGWNLFFTRRSGLPGQETRGSMQELRSSITYQYHF